MIPDFRYRDALNAFTTQPRNPPAPRPAEVADDIEGLVAYNTAVMVPYLDAITPSGSVWPQSMPTAETRRSQAASAGIRRLLGAPAFGHGC